MNISLWRESPIFESKYLLIALYVVSFVIRTAFAFTHLTFAQDQARDWLIMKQYAREHTVFVGLGPKASVGNFYLPPFYYQLQYTLSMLTNNHPLAMLVVILLVESATPVVLYLLLCIFVSKASSLIAALMYSVSTLAITFSTFMWNPNMIPFFSTLSLYLWLLYIRKNKSWAIVGGLFCSTIAFHLHYQSAILLPFIVMLFFYSLFKRPNTLRYWLIGVLASLVLFIPYVVHEISSGWRNTFEIYNYFTRDHVNVYDRVTKPEYILTFIPSFFERVLLGGNRTFFWLGRLVFFAGLGLLALRIRKRATLHYIWLFVYIISILIALRFYKGDKIDYYLSGIFIFPFILFAFITEKIKALVLPLVIYIAFSSGVFISSKSGFQNLQDLDSILKSTTETLNTQTIQAFYHDPDLRNIFVYGFYRHAITDSKDSSVWVDICRINQICNWDGDLACKHDKSWTDMAIKKSSERYTQIAEFDNPSFRVVVGTVR